MESSSDLGERTILRLWVSQEPMLRREQGKTWWCFCSLPPEVTGTFSEDSFSTPDCHSLHCIYPLVKWRRGEIKKDTCLEFNLKMALFQNRTALVYSASWLSEAPQAGLKGSSVPAQLSREGSPWHPHFPVHHLCRQKNGFETHWQQRAEWGAVMNCK